MARPSKFPPNFTARAIEAYRSSPDRTIAESVIGLFKTELIRRRGP